MAMIWFDCLHLHINETGPNSAADFGVSDMKDGSLKLEKVILQLRLYKRPFYSCVFIYLVDEWVTVRDDLALIQSSLLFSFKC